MNVPDAKRLRELESENAKLKAPGRGDAGCGRVAGRRARKILSPLARREAVTIMRAKTSISERQACALLALSRTVLRYVPRPTDDSLQQRLIELAGEHLRFGYRRLHILLEREGFEANGQ